ncbi:MAG TPA: glycosyltransferase, partial [Chitinolyticbacter sp.]|nr:glycosyltransferase [Chitinolyticbacter sp.]
SLNPKVDLKALLLNQARPAAPAAPADAPAAPTVVTATPTLRFSVVMPAYNRERYLADAIAAVLAQPGDDYELIVVDDGSTDRTVAIAEAVNDARLRVVKLAHAGAPTARNGGIDAARGEFIVWADSDDLMAPDALAQLRATMAAHPDADVYYGDLLFFDEARPQGYARTQYPDFHGADLLPLLILGNRLPNPGTAVRRALFEQHGGFDPNFTRCHDYQIWSRLAATARFKKVESIVCRWRQHEESLSSQAKTRTFEAKVVADMVARYPFDRLFPELAQRPDGEMLALGRVADLLASLGDDASAAAVRERAAQLAGNSPARRPDDAYAFSVILTTYNRPELLVDALASLSAQTWRDFEVILVNDHGSPVEALIADCNFPVSYLFLGKNSGLSAARNAGLRQARGRYVVYLDDDDIYLPDHLAVLAATHAQHPDKVVYTGVVYVQEKLENGQRIELAREEPFRHQQFSREQLFLQNYIPVNTWSHPRAAIEVVGGFDESLTALEDWDMLLKLARHYDFVHEPRVTSEVHVRPSSGADHMLGRERKNFPALYRKLYQRHGDLGNAALAESRSAMLRQMDASQAPGEAPARVLSFLDVYAAWRSERRLLPSHGKLFDARIAEWPSQPRIVPVIFDEAGNIAALVRTIRSMTAQYYHPAHIVILSAKPAPAGGAGDNVSWEPLSEAWPDTLRRAMPADAHWLWLLHAGDELEPTATLLLAEQIISQPALRCAYSDEDYLKGEASYDLPIFRPDFNLELLRNTPYIGRALAVSVAALDTLGGFDRQFGALSHVDLLLRVLENEGWPAIGHLDDVLYHSALAYGDWINLEAVQSQLSPVIAAHVARLGMTTTVEQGALPSSRYVRYVHAQQPLVSVILVAPRDLAALQRCVERLISVTTYPHYELLLIDGHGDLPSLRDYLSELDALGNPRLRTFASNGVFNDAAIVNVLSTQANGEYLILLDAGAEVVGADWIEHLLNHGQRPEVGVVGGKLLSHDGKIAQAMQVLGLHGAAGSAFVGQPHDAYGYMNRAVLEQDCSAVSRACMMVRKAVFDDVGGFEAADFAEGGADIDLCLRIHAAGYLTVWTPRVLAVQHVPGALPSSATRAALLQRWLPRLASDAAYNRNLFLHGNGFEIEPRAQLCWQPVSWRPLPVVLAHPGDAMGCGQYRVIQPFLGQQEALQIDGHISWELLSPIDLARLDPDVLLLQRQINDNQIGFIEQYKRYSRAFKVYELDDYLPKLPMKSAHRDHMPKDVLKSMRKALSLVDRFVVSTAPLAEAYAELGLHRDIRVVLNRLPPKWWRDLQSQRRIGARPRVGWGGGMSHTGDLELIVDVVKELAGEVDWVFFGMCPDQLKPYVREFHPGVPIEQYPAKLASLNLDLALAPLEHNLFNECKSNLRLLEYGACGYPTIATDIVCYRGELPVTLVKNRFRDWVEAIRGHVADLDAAAREGDALRAAVLRDWMLEGEHLAAWRAAWLPD